MTTIYDSASGVQHHYVSELDKVTELIGLDRNRVILTVKNPNPSVINSQKEMMYVKAQQYMQGFREHRINVKNPGMTYDTLGSHIEGLKKGQLHIYQNDTDISSFFETTDATAQTILEDLYFTYNHGLKRGFEEISVGSDFIFDDIPKYLFSNIIAKVNTVEPLPEKKQ